MRPSARLGAGRAAERRADQLGRCAERAERANARHEHAEQEGEVADAVDDERLASGVGAAHPVRVERPVVVEADQQVGAEADALPADEHDQQVVAEDEHQHHAHMNRFR